MDTQHWMTFAQVSGAMISSQIAPGASWRMQGTITLMGLAVTLFCGPALMVYFEIVTEAYQVALAFLAGVCGHTLLLALQTWLANSALFERLMTLFGGKRA